jgi:hypothetical protein
MKDAILSLLKSKRISALILGAIATGLLKWDKLGLDPATAQQVAEFIFYGVLAFVGGQSLTDALSGGATSHSKPKAEEE